MKLIKQRKSLLILMFVVLLSGCATSSETSDKVLKKETFTYELGSPISLYASDFVDKDKLEKLSSTSIQVDFKLKDKQTAPNVGEYEAILSYVDHDDKKQEENFTIVIKDSKAPIISNLRNEYEYIIGSKMYDLDDFISVKDASKYTITLDDSEVDYKKEGVYSLPFKVKDESGNVTKEKTKLNVKKTLDKVDGAYQINGIVFGNKQYAFDETYNPGEDETAKTAFNNVIEDMQNKGYEVSNDYSGYRTYETQKDLYDAYVIQHGVEEADTFSARPGHSEHQTGLTFDVLESNGQLLTSTSEANYLKEHAHEYGFIIRYPDDKEDVTGYMYEPWHLRYVGKKLATTLYKENLTLEEYFGIEGESKYK